MSLKANKPKGLQLADLDSLQHETLLAENYPHNLLAGMRQSVSNPPMVNDYLPNKKAAKAAGKKKKVSQKQQLPPMEYASRDTAESKLEELQKLAAGSAALQHAFQSQTNTNIARSCSNANKIVSKPSTPSMTGTEAEFLVRQIQSVDVAQLSLLSNADEFDSVSRGLLLC
jgi:hypothetical protein